MYFYLFRATSEFFEAQCNEEGSLRKERKYERGISRQVQEQLIGKPGFGMLPLDLIRTQSMENNNVSTPT